MGLRSWPRLGYRAVQMDANIGGCGVERLAGVFLQPASQVALGGTVQRNTVNRSAAARLSDDSTQDRAGLTAWVGLGRPA